MERTKRRNCTASLREYAHCTDVLPRQRILNAGQDGARTAHYRGRSYRFSDRIDRLV